MQKSKSEKVFDVLNTLFLSFLMLITLYPCVYVLFSSMSDPIERIMGSKILLFPRGFNLGAYHMVFKNRMIWIGYKNTLTYLIAGTTLNMILTVITAYALSRKYLPGRKLIMKLFVFTMYFSGGMIPIFLLVNSLGMVNTIWAMILPGAISTWNFIIMRTYFMGIPDSMEESAKIDGANDFVILYKIMIPLAVPVIAVVILYYSVSHWNAFFSALLYLRKRELYPLQLILREILIQNKVQDVMTNITEDRVAVEENVKFATIVVSTLPILFFYPYLQKYFMKGIMVGAIKE